MRFVYYVAPLQLYGCVPRENVSQECLIEPLKGSVRHRVPRSISSKTENLFAICRCAGSSPRADLGKPQSGKDF